LPLGLDQAPTGPGDQFNLAGRPGGRGLLGGGGGGSRWGWYATIVQQQIEAALRANPKTRNVIIQVQIRLWADGTGRISRIQLVSSTGSPEIDAAISSEVLTGVMLREPPPTDMPMPMTARITARRPG
jgi:membrane protein involved in colicin uptake